MDDAFRACGHQRIDHHRADVGVAVGDVHLRQCGQRADIEFGLERVLADRLVIEECAVALEVAEHAQFRRFERVRRRGVCFTHIARSVDLVAHCYQHAFAHRFRATGQDHRVVQVDRAIGRQGRRRAHGAHQHHRFAAFDD